MHACLTVVTAYLFLSTGTASQAPTAAELLDKWTQALDSCSSKSFIAKGESTTEHDYRFTNNPRRPGMQNIQDRGTSYRRVEYRTDGDRIYLREYSWGHIRAGDPSVSQERPFFWCLNYAGGKELYRHSQKVGEPGGAVMISKVESYKMGALDLNVQGYLLAGHERTDSVVRRARSLSVRPRMEGGGDRECYVLDAKTEGGSVSLWLDPARGYRLARAELVAKAGDLEYGQPLWAGEVHTVHFNGFRYEDVNGVWMPTEGNWASDLNYGDGSFTRSRVHYRRTQILLNPDHEALGSFLNPLEHPENDPELKNGVQVMKSDERTRYLWQDGKLIPDESRKRSTRTPPVMR